MDAAAPISASPGAPIAMASVEAIEPVLATADVAEAKPARKRRPAKASPATTPAPELFADAAVDAVAAPPIAEPAVDMWVELPPKDEPKAKPAKARRTRAKAKPDVDGLDEPVEKVEASSDVAAPASEAEPVPAAAAPTPTAPATAATVIEAPAEKPKKGWWRRG